VCVCVCDREREFTQVNMRSLSEKIPERSQLETAEGKAILFRGAWVGARGLGSIKE
jgi:hypothetical protein